MLYISKIDGYLEILTDEEVKNSVGKNFIETIREEQNLRKVGKSLCTFLTTPDEVQSSSSDNCVHHYNVEILNLFDPELQLINPKPLIDSKLKELLNKLKKFEFHTTLVLDYNKLNNRKIFYRSAKLIASD